MSAPSLELRFNILEKKIEEVKLRVAALEESDRENAIQYTSLSSSVNHLIDKQDVNEKLLVDIHSKILRTEGANHALEIKREAEHDATTLSLTKRNFYTSIILALMGGSLGIKGLEFIIKLLEGGH